MIMRRYLVPIMCLMALSGRAQSALDEALARLVAHPRLEGASIGLSVREAGSGTVVLEHNPGLHLVPASNQKLLVTAAAWEILGPDWRFPTVLALYGDLTDSIFRGELRMQGYGDPSLGSLRHRPESGPEALLHRWAGQIHTKGVRRMEGPLRAVPERYPGPPAGLNWEWSDLGTCFAQGQWPLNWMENCLPVSLDRDSSGYYLATDSMRLPWPVIYEAQAETSRDLHYVLSGPGDSVFRVGGSLRPALPLAFRVPLPDPPAWLLGALADRLRDYGVELIPGEALPAVDSLRLWVSDTVWSPPLKEIAAVINTDSHNLYAEALLRALGQAREGQPTTAAGLRVIRQWLQRHGLDQKGLWLDDGSGMSRHNALNAAMLAGMLAKVHQKDRTFRGFRDSLARPGRSGTLRGVLGDKRLRDRVWAKTGSLNRVRTLSGYLENRQGRWLSFSLMVNQFDGKPQDFYGIAQQILLALYEHPLD
jgi:serine-type D-Ala-D-Ala carboxypeptidase/endopeptidase (penicillin-binding protein 4)